MQNKRTMIFFAVCAAALITGCDRLGIGNAPGGEASAAAPEAPAAPVFAVNTTQAVQGQIRDYLPLSGDIVASSSVDAYSDAAGKVSRLYVSLGSRVSRGDPLAAVDPSRPGMNYVPSVVRAPVSGTIVALPAQMGMTVNQAAPLARIAGGNGLEIRVYVAERFISKMAAGLPCEISLDAFPGEVFRGVVREVAPVVDPSSRTLEVRINVDNPQSRLKSGMFAKVRIITERKNDIVKIPSAAMIQRFGENFVFSVEADPDDSAVTVARRKIVTPGILIDGVLEIQAGLEPEEEIVLRGQTLLEDGSRINIIERVEPLSAQ